MHHPGDYTDSSNWLAKRWGDVYLHETVIAHIRRLLATDFACDRLYETPMQFKRRMKLVEDHMNSDNFKAPGGGGLMDLAKELPARCQSVLKLRGERLPK